MPVFKNEDNGTWYVMARYVNWKGERKQKCKRGFATKKELLGMVRNMQGNIWRISVLRILSVRG